MVGYALVALVAFVAGAVLTAFVLRSGRDSAPEGLPDGLQETITAFGEELQALSFDPDGPEATAETLREYRLALGAYDRAASAETVPAALAALRAGRAALIRLDARRAGRPVPIDALPALEPGRDDSGPPAVPETATGERFLTTGGGTGTVEMLIDRPEPGRPAIAEVVATSPDMGYLVIHPVVRTEDETDTGTYLVVSGDGSYRGRRLVEPRTTHLRVKSIGVDQRWSVRIRPLSAALPLGTEKHGQGDEVLFYDGGPALLTVQVQGSSGSWKVLFECGCLKGRDCRCRMPGRPAETPGDDGYTYGSGDGRRTLRLPRSGYVVVEMEDRDTWYLSTRPVPQAPRARRERAGRPKHRPQ